MCLPFSTFAPIEKGRHGGLPLQTLTPGLISKPGGMGLSRGDGERETDGKGAAFALDAFNRDRAVVLFNNVLDPGKSDAGTGHPSGDFAPPPILVEHAGEFVPGDAESEIGHA